MNQPKSVPADAGSENAYTYFAFISYKSADEKWAHWLKRNLQRYRLPARTHRMHPQLGLRCSPVFLDKTNLTPGLLDSGLLDEVQSARFLIVICSRAAQENSRYLDAELRYFLEGSGDLSRVIPFIVDESRNPVEECFPAYLAQLCRERDIAGVSVHDDGRRSALLRLIAAMLGIKREELESDDLRRRRRQHLFAAVLALLLLVGTGFCWDYFRIKTAYFTDYAEVYGVPSGIGRLSSGEWKSMCSHIALVSSRGRVRELRCENAAGSLVPDDRKSRLDPFSKAEYEYAGERLSSVKQYDENGHLTVELHYVNRNTADLVRNPEGDAGTAFSAAAPLPSHRTPMDTGEPDFKSNIIRYLFFYDDAGFTREVHYCSDAYNRFAEDADGIAGIRYERDEQGRVTRLYDLSFLSDESTDAGRPEHYQVIGKRSGAAGIAFVYMRHRMMTTAVLCFRKSRIQVNGHDSVFSPVVFDLVKNSLQELVALLYGQLVVAGQKRLRLRNDLLLAALVGLELRQALLCGVLLLLQIIQLSREL
ncbi:MAG: toll/interleukin-1 receptor domain-containing protein, partial [Clostridia bacterium]|nr:toll/interleukin-1 receptor domain-containing protein [Clostridia bacterium]